MKIFNSLIAFLVLFLIFPKLRETWLPFHNITV